LNAGGRPNTCKSNGNRKQLAASLTSGGRCANCKARRFRLDALGMKDTYGECRGQIDYHTCEFYKARPAPKG